MSSAISATPSFLDSSFSNSKLNFAINFCSPIRVKPQPPLFRARSSLILQRRKSGFVCRAEKEHKFPNPIPEFSDSETEKFKTHLLKKLSKKEMFGDSVDEVVGICTEIFNNFLHTEYGGPGTLLVEPFINMADTLTEKGLPGAPQASRAAVKWAQSHVDKDWKEWTTS